MHYCYPNEIKTRKWKKKIGYKFHAEQLLITIYINNVLVLEKISTLRLITFSGKVTWISEKSNLRSVRASNLIENTFSMITFRENLVYVYIAHEDVVWSGARAGRHTCVGCTRKQKRITARKRFGLCTFSEKYTNLFFDRYFYESLCQSYEYKIKYDSVKYSIGLLEKYISILKLWLFDILIYCIF